MKLKKRYLLYSLLAAGVILIDQLSKDWALRIVQHYDFFSLVSFFPVLNVGISWGLLSSCEHPLFLFFKLGAILTVTLLLFVYAVQRDIQKKLILGEVLVLSGALSNWADRLRFDGVIDFIELHYAAYAFPVFNIADCAITCGIIIMIYTHWKDYRVI